MDVIAKCTAAALFASASSLLIKKYNPELSFVLSALVAVSLMAVSFGMLGVVEELVSCAMDMLGSSSTLIRPVLKCMGISFISSFGAELCRDASQGAAASALEFAGTACAAAVSMPIVISMMKMIGTMV